MKTWRKLFGYFNHIPFGCRYDWETEYKDSKCLLLGKIFLSFTETAHKNSKWQGWRIFLFWIHMQVKHLTASDFDKFLRLIRFAIYWNKHLTDSINYSSWPIWTRAVRINTTVQVTILRWPWKQPLFYKFIR